MPSLAVLKVLLREVTTAERIPRTTEPDLVMQDEAQVAAYTRAGREDGVMAPVYLFHCANICEVLRPGDRVLDLACGPATQLAMVARLNPQCQFLGADLSETMLGRARAHVAALGLTNVEFVHTDISKLSMIADQSIDAVMSTMALHHLPTLATLEATLSEASRVLKPGGGIYLADFGRLHAESSVRYFADQYADRQPEIFTVDYYNSLKAAFSVQDFRQAGQALTARAKLYSTFMVPFMQVFKSAPRTNESDRLRGELRKIAEELPDYHRTDLADIRTFFAFGGMRAPLLG
ncbi:MAG: class I SAM-dependent methyltransferase [Moraxellaceae bacterium]|nr:class I SAM-dependent methyltransferase [Moraxellaceae bacterium]